VTLTDLGDAVRQRAKSLLMDSEQLLLEARGVRDNPAGTVDFGVVPAITHRWWVACSSG